MVAFFSKDLSLNRKNAIELTKKLSEINPKDPLKYDLVLSTPAILGICNKDLATTYYELCFLKDFCKTGMRNKKGLKKKLVRIKKT